MLFPNVLILVAAQRILCARCESLVGLDSTGRIDGGTILLRDQQVVLDDKRGFFCDDDCRNGLCPMAAAMG